MEGGAERLEMANSIALLAEDKENHVLRCSQYQYSQRWQLPVQRNTWFNSEE